MWKLAVGSALVFIIGTVAAVCLAEPPPKTAFHIDFCISCGGARFRATKDDAGVKLKRCWRCTKPEGTK